MGDGKQILQRRRAVEVVARIGDPDIEVAEVGTQCGVDNGGGAVRVGIVPVPVEDHQPGSLAADPIERRARGLRKGAGTHRDFDQRGRRPAEAHQHVGRLRLFLGTRLEIGA